MKTEGKCQFIASPVITDILSCGVLSWQYFEHVEEMEWAIEVATSTSLPVCIGPEGDMHGVSAGDCAVRMAKAGN